MLAPSSTLFSSTITEILISDVVIIWMLIPALPSISNMRAATPVCERIPIPTTLSFAIPPCAAKSRAPISVEADRTGMSPDTLRRAFTDHVQYSRSRDLDGATAFDRYMALALAVRDRLVARWS